MIPEFRSAFNAAFHQDKHADIVARTGADINCVSNSRLCESPVFLDEDLTAELTRVASDAAAVVTSADYLQKSVSALPAAIHPPSSDTGPGFLTIDFALTKDDHGRVVPRLIEIQGFPTRYCSLFLIARRVMEAYPLAWDRLTPFHSALTEDTYRSFLYRRIVAGCDPENVVTLEIEPDRQSTRDELAATRHVLGIPTVCATKVTAARGRLFYSSGRTQVPIHRVYNRIVADDLLQRWPDIKQIFTNDIDVEWVGHPSWFYRISKFSLPFIDRPYCPRAQFVSELTEIPADLDNYVLKPLYSHGGKGVELAPSAERLRSLPNPHHFILQRRITYAPVVETPAGATKVEIRMMFICSGDRPVLVSSYGRMSRGDMMNLTFVMTSAWSGWGVAYHPTADKARPPTPAADQLDH